MARFFLSGWYGWGTALEAFLTGNEQLPQRSLTSRTLGAAAVRRQPPPRSASPSPIPRHGGLHAARMDDARSASNRKLNHTTDSTALRNAGTDIYGGTLAEKTDAPNIHLSLQMRRVAESAGIANTSPDSRCVAARVGPLRAQGDTAAAAAILPPLMLTVNAIASGTRCDRVISRPI